MLAKVQLSFKEARRLSQNTPAQDNNRIPYMVTWTNNISISELFADANLDKLSIVYPKASSGIMQELTCLIRNYSSSVFGHTEDFGATYTCLAGNVLN